MLSIFLVMSETYTQLYAHIIFSVKNNKSFITPGREEEIYRCLGGIIEQNGHHSLIIDGTANHVHMLVKLSPANSISNLVREVKRQSSFYINHHLLNRPSFHWQEGYSAFSHTRSQVNAVYKYIEKQKEFHSDKNFHEEYTEMNNLNEDETINEMIFKYKHQ